MKLYFPQNFRKWLILIPMLSFVLPNSLAKLPPNPAGVQEIEEGKKITVWIFNNKDTPIGGGQNTGSELQFSLYQMENFNGSIKYASGLPNHEAEYKYKELRDVPEKNLLSPQLVNLIVKSWINITVLSESYDLRIRVIPWEFYGEVKGVLEDSKKEKPDILQIGSTVIDEFQEYLSTESWDELESLKLDAGSLHEDYKDILVTRKKYQGKCILPWLWDPHIFISSRSFSGRASEELDFDELLHDKTTSEKINELTTRLIGFRRPISKKDLRPDQLFHLMMIQYVVESKDTNEVIIDQNWLEKNSQFMMNCAFPGRPVHPTSISSDIVNLVEFGALFPGSYGIVRLSDILDFLSQKNNNEMSTEWTHIYESLPITNNEMSVEKIHIVKNSPIFNGGSYLGVCRSADQILEDKKEPFESFFESLVLGKPYDLSKDLNPKPIWGGHLIAARLIPVFLGERYEAAGKDPEGEKYFENLIKMKKEIDLKIKFIRPNYSKLPPPGSPDFMKEVSMVRKVVEKWSDIEDEVKGATYRTRNKMLNEVIKSQSKNKDEIIRFQQTKLKEVIDSQEEKRDEVIHSQNEVRNKIIEYSRSHKILLLLGFVGTIIIFFICFTFLFDKISKIWNQKDLQAHFDADAAIIFPQLPNKANQFGDILSVVVEGEGDLAMELQPNRYKKTLPLCFLDIGHLLGPTTNTINLRLRLERELHGCGGSARKKFLGSLIYTDHVNHQTQAQHAPEFFKLSNPTEAKRELLGYQYLVRWGAVEQIVPIIAAVKLDDEKALIRMHSAEVFGRPRPPNPNQDNQRPINLKDYLLDHNTNEIKAQQHTAVIIKLTNEIHLCHPHPNPDPVDHYIENPAVQTFKPGIRQFRLNDQINDQIIVNSFQVLWAACHEAFPKFSPQYGLALHDANPGNFLIYGEEAQNADNIKVKAVDFEYVVERGYQRFDFVLLFVEICKIWLLKKEEATMKDIESVVKTVEKWFNFEIPIKTVEGDKPEQQKPLGARECIIHAWLYCAFCLKFLNRPSLDNDQQRKNELLLLCKIPEVISLNGSGVDESLKTTFYEVFDAYVKDNKWLGREHQQFQECFEEMNPTKSS